MLTGVPSPENGVSDYYDPLPPSARTIAHEMGEAGYRTAHFGKWHLSRRDPTAALVGEIHARQIVPEGERGGFAFWEGFESGFLINDPWLHGTRLPEPVQFAGYQSDVLVDRAGLWIDEQDGAWFAVVDLEAPHPPYDTATPEGFEGRDVADIRLPTNVPETAVKRARGELAGYYRHIAATDRAIARLVAKLSEDVVVIVTSVHGDMHGSHGRFRKGWPYEESVRVPFIVAGAPGIENGSENRAPVSLLDLPGMTRAWGGGRAWSCGRDHAPISMPSVVHLPDQADRIWTGWRSSERKAIFLADGSPWLEFDLTKDTAELENLVDLPTQS